jgi:hypothetical protein
MRRSKLLLAWLLLFIFPFKNTGSQIYDYHEEDNNFDETEDYQNVNETDDYQEATTRPESKSLIFLYSGSNSGSNSGTRFKFKFRIY